MSNEDDAPESRWRYLVLPLVPIVAAWDAVRSAITAWGELGTRLLGRLDPLFARFTGVAIRVGRLVQPLVDRLAARVERIASRVRPAVAWASGLAARLGRRWARLTRAVGRALAPVQHAVRSARRVLGAPFRTAWRAAARGLRPVRRALAKARALLPRRRRR